jgi:hypothetical protein
MRRVAVFGNAGGGKSTLARRLAEVTGLSLYPLDTIQFRAGGGKVPHEEYLKIHTDLISRDQWIIDGYGCVASAWERFTAADTLVYIDLPSLRITGGSPSVSSRACFKIRRAGRRTARFGAARSTATGWFGSAIAG